MSSPKEYREAGAVLASSGQALGGARMTQAAADLEIALRALRSIRSHSDKHDVRRRVADEAIRAITGRL